MKDFIEVIKKSANDKNFYQDLRLKETTYSLSYFAKTAIIPALLVAIPAIILLIPAAYAGLKVLPQALDTYFPKSLSITLKEGQATTTVPTPYIVALPHDIQTSEENTLKIVNAIVIDTENQISTTDFQNYHTVALLTKDALWTAGERNGIKITPLKDLPDGTLNQDTLLAIADKVRPLLPFFFAFLFFAILLGVYVFYSFMALLLTIVALIVAAIQSFRHNPIDFGYAYRATLHASLPIILLNSILLFTPLGIPLSLNAVIIITLACYNLGTKSAVETTAQN